MSDDTQAVEVVEQPVNQEIVQEVQETQEVQAETQETTPAPKQEEDDAPIPKGVQKRIDRAIRRQYEAEAEAKYLREQLQRQQSIQPQTVAQQEIVEPKLENFQNYDEYIEARAAYIAERKVQDTLSQHNQRLEMERAQAAQRQTVESWNQKVAKATAELPDFADVVGSSNLPMPDHVKAMVMQSDVGPKLAYYLASHPDEAEQIANQHPLAAVRSLVRIEDKISSEKSAKKATDAPAPITPVGSKAKAEKAPEDMSYSEFSEWRRKQISQRR